MNELLKQALTAKLLAMADDELILGHRCSEWCGHAPILEEDIAFANIALDEIGHAVVWYELLADLNAAPRDTYPDHLVYQRSPADFRCAQFVELPKGDWALTMTRQYLFDTAENVYLTHLQKSAYTPLAQASAKIYKEEVYHVRHTRAWVRRLGLGTAESQQKMQNALDFLWPYALQLFEPLPDDSLLVEAGYFPESSVLRAEWAGVIVPYLTDSGLTVPANNSAYVTNRQIHTEHLSLLLDSLQLLSRQYPSAIW